MTISQDGTNGLGLVATQEIPKGSQLIALADHLPLRFVPLQSSSGDGVDEVHSLLANLAQQVPGMHFSLFYAVDYWIVLHFWFYIQMCFSWWFW